jgi:rRNA-processing protein FCF1
MTRIFIDANALTLYVLGSVNRRYIGNHRRLEIYDDDDFEILSAYIEQSKEVLITPNIWTEVDNLCHDSIRGKDKYDYVTLMQQIHKEWIPEFVEKYMKTADAVLLDVYSEIGLSDAIALELSRECDLLVTADSKLSDLARANNIMVLDLKAEVTKKALLS